MAFDSTQSGYLAPETTPTYDLDLDLTLQAAIAGVTGLDPSLVRPRLQPSPPNQPQAGTNWCAFGVVRSMPDTVTWEFHDPTGDGGIGTDLVQQDEIHEVLLSFFGPAANKYESIFRVGIQIGQNRDALTTAGVGFVEVRGPVILPALLKEQFVRRVDSTFVIRRRVELIYPIRTVVELDSTINFDNGVPAETIVANASSAPQQLKPPRS